MKTNLDVLTFVSGWLADLRLFGEKVNLKTLQELEDEAKLKAQALDELATQLENDKLLLVHHQQEFGRNRFYPACDTSRLIADKLAGCKSFTIEQLKTLDDLGYVIKPIGDQETFDNVMKGGDQ